MTGGSWGSGDTGDEDRRPWPDTNAVTRCTNCGAALGGRYCHRCGQRAGSLPESLRAFVIRSLRDVFSFRSRTLRSLVHLVVRPGELTAAFLGGRRVRYTQPLEVYLLAAAVFFLADAYRPFISIGPDGEVVSSLSAAGTQMGLGAEMREIEERGGSVELFRERFRWTVSRSLPHFMIGSILLFALALAAFNPGRTGLRHVVFSLHWTGFFLFVMSFERLLPEVPGPVDPVALGFLVAVLAHLVLSLRRAYDHSWARAVASGVGLLAVFNVILALWMLAVVGFAARQAA